MNTPWQLDKKGHPSATLETMLRRVLDQLEADQVFVGAFRQRGAHLETLVEYPEVPRPVRRPLSQLLASNPMEAQILQDFAGFACALLLPFPVDDDLTALVALFSQQPDSYQLDALEAQTEALDLLRLALENHYLQELNTRNRVLSNMIHLAAQSMMDYPSPQHLVNLLCEQLFNHQISTCAVLLFGPVREDPPQAPFEYLELAASWSRRFGNAIALGTKIYLSDQAPFPSALNAGKTILVNDNVSAFAGRFDPFVRSLLRAERIRSMILTPLNAGPRRIGLMFLGSKRANIFTDQDLNICQTVSEFMALSATTQILRQQRDLIQWGRAALLDLVTNGVVMVLPDAEGARVLTVNKVFGQMFSLAPENTEGLMLFEMLGKMQIPESLRQKLRSLWLEIPVRETEGQRGEFHIIHSDGYPVDIEWYSGPVYQDERVMGRIYTFRDVTAERMAINLRSAFLSRISHELRTPLTTIHGFAQLILNSMGDELPPRAEDYTRRILAGAQHLRDIFNDMIELTRADSGEINLQLASGDLRDVVDRAVAQRELQYVARGVQILVNSAADLPPLLFDVNRIMQVLNNILDNAIKFSPENSHLHIHLRYVDHPSQLPEHAPLDIILPGVLVEVSDQGPGIAPPDMEQIFMPFFRTTWAQQQQLGGTGLGLAVSRSIIELHRGKLWAEPASPQNPGGHFIFSLPAEKP